MIGNNDIDRLDTLQLFTRIVERGNFGLAAADLGISRPSATAAIQKLEERLGVLLLHRTTRHVQATVQGEAYYRRCAAILSDLEDADRDAAGNTTGLVRVDVAGLLARTMLLPALPDFLARHPGLSVHLGEGERLVDLVREGVDCVVRAGELADSGMIVRRLGVIEEITCASPGYLAKHGIPDSPHRMEGHAMIGFVSSRTGLTMPLEFTVNGQAVKIALPSRLLVSAADTSAAAALMGLGIVQAPRLRFADDLASGALVEILAEFAPAGMPISVLHAASHQPPPRLRLFLDWLVETWRLDASR